ncbi:MAG: hypothetical protein HOD92_19805, partial [Deltaproteobacteria bacterium]|nr:hypothetical protein [Deltaproteobacteria bacterium]
MTREKTIPATVLIKVVSWMLLLLIPINVFAASLDEATEKAAMTLLKNGLNNNQKMQLVVEVFNVDSNKKDIEARKIESSLFTALQSRFPNAKLL